MRLLRVAPEVLDRLEGPGAEVGTSEATAALVESLPEPYRTIVDGIFWEQVSRRALARRIGVPRSAIERLYREAMELLRQRREA